MTCPVPIWKPEGALRFHDESKTLPVPQIRPSYCATRSLPFFTTGPVPWIRVWTCSVAGGDACGRWTDGGVPGDEAPTVGRPLPVAACGVPCALAVFW